MEYQYHNTTTTSNNINIFSGAFIQLWRLKTHKNRHWLGIVLLVSRNNWEVTATPLWEKCYLAAYQTLEDELKAFVDNDIPLPLGVNLQCLDNGSGIAFTMLKNETKYHNGCRGHFRSHNQRSELFTFTNRPPTDLKKGTDKLGSSKANTALITKMSLSLQARPNADVGLDDFFQIRKSARTSITVGSRKASWVVFHVCLVRDELQQLERLLCIVVLDMAAAVHIIKPQRASVFGEYTEMQLLPYLDRTTRVDAIWST